MQKLLSPRRNVRGLHKLLFHAGIELPTRRAQQVLRGDLFRSAIRAVYLILPITTLTL